MKFELGRLWDRKRVQVTPPLAVGLLGSISKELFESWIERFEIRVSAALAKRIYPVEKS